MQQLLPPLSGQQGDATLSQTPLLPRLISPAPDLLPRWAMPRKAVALHPSRWESACIAVLKSQLPARGWRGAVWHQPGHGAAAGTRCLLLSWFSFLPLSQQAEAKGLFGGCGWAG